ncbi:MAG: selenocysteine-specific translation elongation factor [Candidatus Dormibacteria bacterium]
MISPPVMEAVVGTAGHVDHGKTALVKALTGVDTDRLELERRRGMSIELGFAAWRLPSGREVSLVDVPGHERFVRTMALGARSVDLALLCIAADDGLMPQTREHAAVLALLGVPSALVVVTKVELRSEAAREVAEQGRRLLERAGVAYLGWVAVSALRRQGLGALTRQVDQQLGKLGPRPDRGLPRLRVDRSFSVAGAGTVVTGLLDGGELRVGQEVEVFPSRARGRVSGMQRRGGPVPSASPAGRLALALRGISVPQVGRGSAVAALGRPLGSRRLDCLLQVPGEGASGVRHGMRLQVLGCPGTVPAQLWLAGQERVQPGHAAFCQLVLARRGWTFPGDRLVLRAPAPAATLAGVLVLDADPAPHRRWTAAPLDIWSARQRALQDSSDQGPVGLVALELERHPLGLNPAAVAERVVLRTAVAQAEMERLAEHGLLVRAGSRYFAPGSWRALCARAEERLRAYRRSRPLEGSMPQAALLSALGLEVGRDGEGILSGMAQAGSVELSPGRVGLPGSGGRGQATPAAIRVLRLLEAAGAAVPGGADLRQAGATPAIAAYLEREGRAVRLGPGLLIASPAAAELQERLLALLGGNPQGLSVASLRDQLGTTRRVLIPLLERLDREGHTERRGDLHLLREEP